MAPRLEKRLLGQRAGGYEPHDVACDDGLGAALLRFGRILHLLGDGDAEPLADQGQQITFGRVHRHAAHRYVLTQMQAAFGQRDVQRCRCRFGVGEEHLVEVPHPVEQERIGIAPLDLQILGHHWSDGRHVVVLRHD